MVGKQLIDLFCGAGGFSIGAHLAGFQTTLAVDIDPKLTSSYTDNFPNAKLLLTDISKASGKYLLQQAKVRAGEVSGIIGGPPCQGFSLIGQRDLSDPRNQLVGHFFRVVSEIRPAFFVMENVPGLLLGAARKTLDNLISDLKGYEILGPFKANAADFGAATRRDRVLLIGCRGAKLNAQDLDLTGCRAACVRDAISDLPEPTLGGWGTYREVPKLSRYAATARKTMLNLGDERLKKAIRDGRITGFHPTRHSTEVRRRFSTVLPGQSDKVSRCPRLHWDTQAPTLRAGTGPDHGSFQSIRPIHPDQNRVITVREAARLQGFPDWFKFHETKWHSFRMIGNSVSPMMSEALLRAVMQKLYI